MGRILKKYSCRVARRKPKAIFAVLGLVLCVTIPAASGEQIKKRFPTVANPSLLLHSYNGNIRILGWELNEMEIQGERSSPAVEVVIAEGEEKVTVEARPISQEVSNKQSRVDFQIQVPRQATVRVDSHQGEITVEGV